MSYGLRLTDTSENLCKVTPDVSNIIAAGKVYMPGQLWNNNTYGANIALPGTHAYAEDEIGVTAMVLNSFTYLNYAYIDDGAGYTCARWLVNGGAYYTRNDTTGVLTSFTSQQYKDTNYNGHSVAFWDKMGQTSFTSIRIFAAECFEVYDRSAASYIKVYHLLYPLGNVLQVDYAVYLKNI